MKEKLFDAMAEISSKIKSIANLDELLTCIGKIIHETVAFDKSSIVLYDGTSLVMKVYNGYIPDKTVFSPEEWFTEANINPQDDCYIVERPHGGQSISFVLRSSDDMVLGFLRGIMFENNTIDENRIKYLAHCSSFISLLIERNKLQTEKNINENLQIIGMLKSSVVHDISNLLGIVEVYVELVESESKDNAAVIEYMGSVRSELKRVNVIAKDLLDFSKQKLNLHIKEFSLETFAAELERYCKVLVKEMGIDIQFEVTQGLKMSGDEDRLFRVFFNLINNAADALHNKGGIIVRIKKAGNNIIFLVADNGKGIKKESIGHLFDPFFTSGKAKGSGLGLAVVREIVQSHGGKASVRSVEGKYTCFLIRIPA